MKKRLFVVLFYSGLIIMFTGCLSFLDVFKQNDKPVNNPDNSQNKSNTAPAEIAAEIAVSDPTVKTTSLLNLALGYNITIKNTAALPIEKGVCSY
ncbi:MAG TPA: hypothetical protein PLI57_04395, partial [Spirochaetota bacterium]|nr:hypothetical protein [Spirochaetota bacterium]